MPHQVAATLSITDDHPLFPTQARTLATLERALDSKHVAVLAGRTGLGKTRLLRELHGRLGGAYLTSRAVIEASDGKHPLALEETVYHVVREALEHNPAVIVDDFHFVSLLACCAHAYPRAQFLGAAILPLVDLAQQSGKRLVFASEGMPIPGLAERLPFVTLPNLTPEDYAALCAAHMGASRAAALDIRKVHRFAPNLTARQLQGACDALREEASLDTERFITHLREHHMASNVDLGEVQAVDLHDLKGIDDVHRRARGERHSSARELRGLGGARPHAQARRAARRSAGNGQDDDRPRARASAQEQVLSDRRHHHQRDAAFLPARPPRLRGGQDERAGDHLRRRQRRDLRERAARPASIGICSRCSTDSRARAPVACVS